VDVFFSEHSVYNDAMDETSSSAAAQRPRDALCLSIVSFNSTIHRAQSSIIGYFSFRFTAAYNEMLFCSFLFSVFAAWMAVP